MKNKMKKGEVVITVLGLVAILITLIISIVESNILFGLLCVAAISLGMCFLLFILFLFDKKDVDDINKKINQNNDQDINK